VKRFVKEVLRECPGFAIDIQDGPVRLGWIITAGLWKQGDKVLGRTYKTIRDRADEFNLTVDAPELVG
jgi:hypothetical protein